jgi:hypothetical protein
MKIICLLTFLFVFAQPIIGQNTVTQTIRGTVIDKESKIHLPGVNILIEGTDPKIGVATDEDGKFKIEKVPVGQYTIQISFVGYETQVLPNVEVTSGKEVVLSLVITEAAATLETIVIKAGDTQGETLNEFSVVSGRSFSIDESKKYAGTFNDPSRMVTTFAGVQGGGGADDVNNDIVIRGNSPRGLLWRVEGVEVPSPNHFTDQGASSGSVSILSSNMLATSDFFTGAFPANYGNALSGVFDMKLRNGNNEKREYAVRAGVIGLDASAEGPFKKGYNGSYLVNYRYSTLSILNDLGIKLVDNALPIFQDLSFKLFLPTSKRSSFSVFGMGGLSNESEYTEGIQQNGTFGKLFTEKFNSDLGILGLNHQYIINDKINIESILSFSASRIGFQREVPFNGANILVNNEDFGENTGRFSFALNQKIDARNYVQSGIIYSHLGYDVLSQFYSNNTGGLADEINDRGNTGVIQAYSTWKRRIGSELTLNIGLHFMNFLLNGNNSIEPRAGIKWALAKGHSLGVGAGLHSRREGVETYLSRQLVNGNIEQSNKNLNFAKAIHYIVGYDWFITPALHFKAELYYQDIFNVPVVDNSSSSTINLRKGFNSITFINSGTGNNHGIELTLEKFLGNSYYFATNISLFKSTYKGGDKVERNTAYNSNFLFNALAGKDFQLNKAAKFNVNIRGVYTGGQRYIPIDLAQSIAQNQAVYLADRAYQDQLPNYFRADFQASYSFNRTNRSYEIRLEIQNITDRAKQQIKQRSRGQILPVVSVQVKF